jgi:hypothetical protein
MYQRLITNGLSAVAGSFGGLAVWRGTQHHWASMVGDILLCLGFALIAFLRLRQEHKRKVREP